MKSILCDIGGVMLKVNFDVAFDRLNQEAGLTRQEVTDRIFTSGLKDQHDSGIIDSYRFYKRIINDDKISFERFQVIWGEIFTENREMVDYIRSCSRYCRLFIASNTDPVHFDFFVKKYPWFSMFEGYGLSFRLKSMKPSPEFFHKICQEFGIQLWHQITCVS
jgi:FMN phosphatase YigB (HAD superfamily)